MQLVKRVDKDGNETTFEYTDGFLTKIDDASLYQHIELIYTGDQLTEIRVVSTAGSSPTYETVTRYTYDDLNRLSQVVYDLSPKIDGIADGKQDLDGQYLTTNGAIYVTNYSYDGDSNRIASITQGNGVSIGFTYDQSGRIQTYTDGEGNTTTVDYSEATTV